jgi:FkbM family methyltransferase
MKTHFFVTNMQCAGCVARVHETIRRNQGVVSVNVDLGARLVAFEYLPETVDPLVVHQQLKVSGFDLSVSPPAQDNPIAGHGPDRDRWNWKRLAGLGLFHLCNELPDAKVWLRRWGLRTKKEWFAGRVAKIQLPGGQHLKLASVGENYLSFQLFWLGAQYYEPVTTLLLGELLRPDDTFIDVGANIGFYSLVLTLTQPGIRVIAFEPNPRIHALLKQNIAANHLHNITYETRALSDAEGTATLYLSRSDHSASLRPDFEAGSSDSIVVPTLTLDAYLESLRRDRTGRLVLKIDAEGHEEAVLRGAWTTLCSLKPDIVVETAQHLRDGPLPSLKELGYRLHSITDRGLIETSTWAPVVRGPYVFLNCLLTARPPAEVAGVFERIKDRVKWIDLGQTSKLADPVVLERAVGKPGAKGEA